MIWWLLIIVLIIAIILIRIYARGFFWRARDGTKLSIKEFFKRWKKGVISSTPLQQTTLTLWAFLPILAGITYGIVVTAMTGTWWMVLILAGSLPITLIQALGTFQKYLRLKQIEETMRKIK